MDEKIAEAIGLLRHKIISPVLMESGRSQMEYFRSLESQEFDVPGAGSRKFKASTMRNWLHRYKRYGFKSIVPKARKDFGQYRRCSPIIREKIVELRKNNMELSVVKFYRRCQEAEVIGSPPLCLATVRRFLKNENLINPKTVQARKKFEHGLFGDLWTGDFMHGPLVLETPHGKRRKKAILMAIIDDHSRMIVGARFGFNENTLLLENVFREALLQYGICDRLYVDNGASFSSQYLSRVCANLGIGLVHSKPYDSPSRGKVERFFRTVRGSFLSFYLKSQELDNLDIPGLNECFESWLRTEYHHSHHKGINMRPIDRYQTSITHFPRKMVDEEVLEEFFFVSVERVVSKDCTVRFKGTLYELPPHTIGRKVELRFSQEEPEVIYYYENGQREMKLVPLDAKANAREYRPSPRDPHISLQGVIQND